MADRKSPDRASAQSRSFAQGRTRRELLGGAAAGTVLWILGGCAQLAGPEDPAVVSARNELLSDGRRRLPPGQRLLKGLKPMGGQEGDSSPGGFRLRISGEVRKPFELSFSQLLALPQTEQTADVHCVTGWSCLDVRWTGVRVADLAEKAGLKSSARYVIFEAAHGYTTNVPLQEALQPEVLVAHRMNGEALLRENGAPVRGLVPRLYFWKSAKWLTGIRFIEADEPGYWETRGYHNHADPWREERYS